jgi:hypothetical protein
VRPRFGSRTPLPVWQSRASHGLSRIYDGRIHNRLAKIPSEIGHNKTQQHQGDKTPKYPSPRLVTTAIWRRFFRVPVHHATANSTFLIRAGSLSSARELFTEAKIETTKNVAMLDLAILNAEAAAGM